MLIGSHESTAGGYYKAVLSGKEDGSDCVQIFTKSPRMWMNKTITDAEAELFKATSRKEGIVMNSSHASYLINIAHENKVMRNKAINSLVNELDCAEKLGLISVILHPGANNSNDKCRIVSDSINESFNKSKSSVMLAIETTSGSGSVVGSRFEELKEIIDNVENKKRVAVCFDTCHAFASGYDLREEDSYNNTFKEFDKIIGLNKLFAFHLNDSMKGLGEKIDRHEQIGLGMIGMKCFKMLVNDKRFLKIPGYLETPELKNGESSFAFNIRKLRRLVI
ncbi:endonuclease 4 [Candidatus Tiddalikarchaeum anstoanum]|nr:endonuclease 4 [Candidatus Tiddalikarchaeum anstoanum]